MLRRSLFACALMLAGVVGFASSAKAAPTTDTATVQLAIDLPTSCSFGSVANTPGALKLGTTDSTFTTDTPATIDISCNGAATLSVAAPVLAASSTGSSTFTATSTATLGTKNATDGASTSIDATDNGTISVSMDATSTTTIQAGLYNFDIVLTTAP
jgi:hypothetical protein